jgi:hypothetical protein
MFYSDDESSIIVATKAAFLDREECIVDAVPSRFLASVTIRDISFHTDQSIIQQQSVFDDR